MTPSTVPCPTCRRRTLWQPENPYRPFCSQRCKLIDLGAWAQEQYSLPAQAGNADGWEQA